MEPTGPAWLPVAVFFIGRGHRVFRVASAKAAVDLYGEHPAVAYSDLAAEVGTEVRLLQAVRAELTGHAEARADAYRWTDPARLAASLPGLGEVGAPTVTAIVGRAARFRTGKGVPLLHRAGARGQRNRRDRPQGPAHEQGRQPAAAHHLGPGRGQRPQGRSATRPDLLHPDGGARRRATQGPVSYTH